MGLARMQLRPIRDPVKLMTRLTRFVGNVRARYEVFTRYDRRGSPARVEDTLKSCTFRERSDVYRGQKHLPSLKATPLSIRCAISLSRNSNDETCMCVCVYACVLHRANDVSFRRVAVVRCETPLSIYGRRSLFIASNSLHS